MKTVVVGMGNLLRCDDGVGLRVAEALRNERLSGVEVRDGISAMDILEGLDGCERLIIIDAVRTGEDAGTVHIFTADELRADREMAFASHGMDIISILDAGERLFPGTSPKDVKIIAVQAGDISLSDKCTPEVQAAIPQVVNLILRLIQ